jgi:hypothetical protein
MADNKVMRALEAQVHPTRMTRANFSTVPPLLARRSPYLTFPGRPRTDTTDATTQVDSTHRRGPPPAVLVTDLARVDAQMTSPWSHTKSHSDRLSRQLHHYDSHDQHPLHHRHHHQHHHDQDHDHHQAPASPPTSAFSTAYGDPTAPRGGRIALPEGLREAFLHGPEYRISALRKRKIAEITETNISLDNTRECPTSRCESDARH